MNEDRPKSKYELALLTKLAQQTQRYDQMATYAKSLLLSNQQLTGAQRNLCASAFKNLVNNRRAEIKVLNAIAIKMSNKQTKQMNIALKKYKSTIEKQLVNTCLDVLKIIQSGKINIKSVQPKIFFLKMRADFYRYLCQIDDNDGKYFHNASSCYQQADTLARSNLPPTNEVRLSLHLNMSVFLKERCGEVEKALDLANRAFDQAVANVNQTNQQSFKNCTMILQLIRDNINLWSEQFDA